MSETIIATKQYEVIKEDDGSIVAYYYENQQSEPRLAGSWDDADTFIMSALPMFYPE